MQWLQERLFDYSHFSQLYFMDGERIDMPLLSERCHDLGSETLAIEVHSALTSASIRWRGSNRRISMTTFGGISAVAVLRAMIDNARTKFNIDALVVVMPFECAKIREWAARMKDPTYKGHNFRRNAFSSSTVNAISLLATVVGNPCIEGRQYQSLKECRVNWILKPRPNVTKCL